ncbi:hypothetical protein GCM10009555_006640 [Acrocarpospora macrocephala]|uniref:Uncharacterized protein n=1 Tax=Acrocarpospora macrocephala TaxID=150177 RepID=A0A5M3WXZ2_9ACTN|nr:hypothetical protein [Acrocarpospora macrocephala]GES13132.1 hypothetical protein Amac_067290 [Acrocarpospora macrocephala]
MAEVDHIEAFDLLIRSDVAPRREFIVSSAAEVDRDRIDVFGLLMGGDVVPRPCVHRCGVAEVDHNKWCGCPAAGSLWAARLSGS